MLPRAPPTRTEADNSTIYYLYDPDTPGPSLGPSGRTGSSYLGRKDMYSELSCSVLTPPCELGIVLHRKLSPNRTVFTGNKPPGTRPQSDPAGLN